MLKSYSLKYVLIHLKKASHLNTGDDHFENSNHLNTVCLGQFEKGAYLNYKS
jgi:hypothetical protein